MRVSHLIFTLAALGLAIVPPIYAEETVNGPVYLVTYFEIAPTAAAQGAAVARQYAEASRKENGNDEFDVFEEVARPSRFAILEAWRDKNAADAHDAGAAATAFRGRLQPMLIGGFGVRPHGGLSVAAAKAQFPPEAL
jgi:quinol monooxygenase YgiN